MDIPILKYVDVLIGLALVMVLVSTVVLAITQALLNMGYARARHLRGGLTRMILQIHPVVMKGHARYLASLLLRHPLVGHQTMFTPVRRVFRAVRAWARRKPDTEGAVLPPVSPGTVVQRDELAYLFIEFAAGEGPLMDPVDSGTTPAAVGKAQEALAAALRTNGIEDPAATLRAIRLKMVENERARPEEPAHRWRTDAVVDSASSDFIGKVHQSFDSTMARVTDGFGAESQLWVAVVALFVALALQLDSFALLKRLSIDDEYRTAFVDIATELQKEAQDPTASQEQQDDAKAQLEEARESLLLLRSPSINLLPQDGLWLPALTYPASVSSLARWPADTVTALGTWLRPLRDTPGILLSWILLSLGAPFWFDALKNLLKLRSILAKKDDEERKERQASQPAKTTATPQTGGVAAERAGEAGDLTATGALG